MATAPTGEPTVVVDGVSKQFKLPHEQMHTLKERVLHPVRRRRVDRLDALKGVSFEVYPGEFFGIVGRNGSGKSTLLKCLAGIYRTDGGEIWLRGRMAPFIELGVGFNPDLTARDNVILNAVMLGLTPEEARERFDDIIAFAELEDFVDLKLKNYSSGMYVRLGFAVMVQVEADVVLIDEVLAVGDAAFQQKCYERLDQIQDSGSTVLFVTHDMATVERRCNRSMLLDEGELVEIGESADIARRYNALNFPEGNLPAASSTDRQGDHGAVILDAWFEDAEGRRVPMLDHGPSSFRMLVEFREDADRPSFGVLFTDDARRTIFSTSSDEQGRDLGSFSAGEQVEVELRFENVLSPGGYAITPWVSHFGTGNKLMDLRPRLCRLTVLGTRHSEGLIELPHSFAVERSPAPAESRAS